MKRVLSILVLLWAVGAPALGQTSDTARARKLENDIRWLVNRHKGRMKAGVAIVHLASGEKVEVNASEPYPLASVFKLPIMLELARQIQHDENGLSLSLPLVVRESERCIGSGRLQDVANGTSVSLERCVELMETISDNTATDMIFERIGLESVDKLMHAQGLKSSQIYLTNRQAWLISLAQGSDFRGLSPAEIAAKWKKLSLSERKKAAARVAQETRSMTLSRFQQLEDASRARNTHSEDVLVAAAVDNLMSPRDLARLLVLLRQGKLLDRRWTRYCLDVLSRQKFNTRIPRMLPSVATVYHKTGTIAGVVNDAGIVEMDPGNDLAIVVLVRDVAAGASGDAETLIAKVARMAYDRY
ncbi:MAG: serine hydrolase [Armatimonadetes bacterium]|nr:serine hydrolase [Armatimonadota bacterium]